MALTITVRQLIDQARIRHHAFTDVEMPDGAALLYLNQRQRTLLAKYGPSIEGLVSSSQEVAAVISGALAGVDENGALYQTTTNEIGFAVHLDGSDLYVDPTENPLSVDPFGEDGGTPGFPLPSDFLRLINCTVVLDDHTLIPLVVQEEQLRLQRNRMPVAFVNGNRLVPARPLSEGNTNDVWTRIVAVQVSYVAMRDFSAVDDVVHFPVALVETLLASLAAQFARQSPRMSPKERQEFANEERHAESQIQDVADQIVRAQSAVIFRR